VPSGTRCEYIPVRSTAAYLPLTVPERTTHTHVNAVKYPGLLRSYQPAKFPQRKASRGVFSETQALAGGMISRFCIP
jgi:hypothetical protein